MKIGIPVDENKGLDSRLSEHFGRTPFYVFVDVDNGAITKHEQVKNPFEQHSPGQIPAWVHENGVKLMIVQGIGTRAISFFNEFGIQVIKGNCELAGDCVKEYLAGNTLDEDPACNHDHDSHEHQPTNEQPCKKKYGTVAISLQEKSLDSVIDDRFARGKIIAIINGETSKVDFIDNNPKEEHGVGPKIIGMLSEKGVNTVIAKSLGQNASLAAQEAGIKVKQAVNGTGTNNLLKLWNEELNNL